MGSYFLSETTGHTCILKGELLRYQPLISGINNYDETLNDKLSQNVVQYLWYAAIGCSLVAMRYFSSIAASSLISELLLMTYMYMYITHVHVYNKLKTILLA